MCEQLKNAWYGSYGPRARSEGHMPKMSWGHLLDAAIFLTKFGLSAQAGWKLVKVLPVKPRVLGYTATTFGAWVFAVVSLGNFGVISRSKARRFNPQLRLADLGCLSVGLGLLGSLSFRGTQEAVRRAIIILQSYPVRRVLRITPELLINCATLFTGAFAVAVFSRQKLQGTGNCRPRRNEDAFLPRLRPKRWG